LAEALADKGVKSKIIDKDTLIALAALAAKSGNIKIIFKDTLIALDDATHDLSMPCHEHTTGAAIRYPVIFLNL